jgi:hypothetical protein
MAQKFTVPVTIKNLSSAGSDGLTVFLDQESFARLKVEAGGRFTWGDGSIAGDTNLYRDAASVLKTDDTFKAAGLYVTGTQIDPTGATVGDALVFNGTKFVSASVAGGGATLTVADVAPEEPSLGDLWFNSTDLEIYVYYSSSWIQVTDSSSGVQELYELVDVLIDNPIDGEALVYNGAEWTNEVIYRGYYGSFYDTTNLLLTSATTAYPLPLNTTAEAVGVSIASGSRITVANAGVYNIQFSAQLDKTDAGSDLVNIWFSKNGVNIPYSNTQVYVTGGNGKYLASWNFVLTLAANDYFQIMAQSPDTHMRVVASGTQSNPARPEVPSTIVTVTQVR